MSRTYEDVMKEFSEGKISFTELREGLAETLKHTEERYADYSKTSRAKTDREAYDETKAALETGTYFQLIGRACWGSDNANAVNAQKQLANIRTKTTMAEGTTTLGGHTVPDELNGYLVSFIRDSSAILPYCREIEIGSDYRKVPVLNQTMTVGWHDESEEMDESNLTFTASELEPQRLDAYTVVTNELLMDSKLDMIALLLSQFTESCAVKIDSTVFNSDGSTSNFSGLFTAAVGYSSVMGAGSAAFSSVVVSELIDLYNKVPSYARKKGQFYMHPDIIKYLAKEESTGGDYLINPYSTPELKIHGRYPLIESSEAPSTSGGDTAFIVFGNPQYLAVGRRHNIEMRANPYSLDTFNQTRFTMFQRLGFAYLKNTAFARLLTAS